MTATSIGPESSRRMARHRTRSPTTSWSPNSMPWPIASPAAIAPPRSNARWSVCRTSTTSVTWSIYWPRRSPAHSTERTTHGLHICPTEPARPCLTDGELVIAPGVFDGITAHLARRTGQPAAYMTGAGVAASGFGLPDIGLVTATEMAERARMLVGVLGDVPLIADADTGYGTAMNVVRTVQLYEQAGVAAIQLEDQVFPEALRASGRQAGCRRRGFRADAGRRARCPHRRRPAGRRADRRPSTVRA